MFERTALDRHGGEIRAESATASDLGGTYFRGRHVTGDIARGERVDGPERAGTTVLAVPGAGKKSVRRAHRILPARYVCVQVADGLRLLGDNRVDQVAD
jgi:hypothetical protein